MFYTTSKSTSTIGTQKTLNEWKINHSSWASWIPTQADKLYLTLSTVPSAYRMTVGLQSLLFSMHIAHHPSKKKQENVRRCPSDKKVAAGWREAAQTRLVSCARKGPENLIVSKWESIWRWRAKNENYYYKSKTSSSKLVIVSAACSFYYTIFLYRPWFHIKSFNPSACSTHVRMSISLGTSVSRSMRDAETQETWETSGRKNQQIGLTIFPLRQWQKDKGKGTENFKPRIGHHFFYKKIVVKRHL